MKKSLFAIAILLILGGAVSVVASTTDGETPQPCPVDPIGGTE